MANPYDQVAIYQFPHEIFHSIFGFAVSEDYHELDRSRIKRPIASFTLSQVSQRFRDIALDLPIIWTNIRIFHFRDSQRDMVQQLIHSRTKGFPLSITLEYDQSLVAAQRSNYWEIILAIKSCSSRWESLSITFNDDLFTQICGNFGCPEAPLLQRLELVVLGHPKYHHNFGFNPEDRFSPLYLEIRNTHLLKKLVLIGICLRMPSPAYMEQLETLRLDHVPAIDMLDRPPVTDTLPLITRLRSLILTRTVLTLLPGRSYLSEYTSTLTSLSLSSVRGYTSRAVHIMFDHLPTTTLRELSISDVDSAFWIGFLDSMGPGSDPKPPRYPALRKLHLEDVVDEYAGDPPVQLLDFNFPQVEVLDLFAMPNLTALLKDHTIFSRLHTLRVRRTTYRDLCDLIDLRIERSIPLTTLEVDTPPFLDLSSLGWLRRKVPNFERTG